MSFNLKTIKGVTVIIYDQTCATEKRRRRKRGKLKDPDKRIFINHYVCEGCGDCSVESNCISVEPLKTEYGTKRVINQSTCNKDYSCANGFCPSFLSIEGGNIKKRSIPKLNNPTSKINELKKPNTVPLDNKAFSIIVTGIGGTGVVTIGALIGMAAHIFTCLISHVDVIISTTNHTSRTESKCYVITSACNCSHCLASHSNIMMTSSFVVCVAITPKQCITTKSNITTCSRSTITSTSKFTKENIITSTTNTLTSVRTQEYIFFSTCNIFTSTGT